MLLQTDKQERTTTLHSTHTLTLIHTCTLMHTYTHTHTYLFERSASQMHIIIFDLFVTDGLMDRGIDRWTDRKNFF